MTTDQIDYLWDLACRDGDQADLRARFPDVDWDAAEAREAARWEEVRRRTRNDPRPSITLDQVAAVQKEIFEKLALDSLFDNTPLLERLKR